MLKFLSLNKFKVGVFFTLFLCVFFNSNHALAKTTVKMDTFDYIFTETTGVYYLGTTESLELAKETIIETAKKEASDFSGTFVDKQISLSNDKILKDEINFYSFSQMSLNSYSEEKFITKEGVIGLKYNVMMSLKKSSIKDGLKTIKENIQLETKFKELQAKHDNLVKMLTINKSDSYVNKQSLVDLLYYNSKSVANLSSIKSIKALKEESDNEVRAAKSYLKKIYRKMWEKGQLNIDKFDVKLGREYTHGFIKYHVSIDDSEFKTALVATMPNLFNFSKDGALQSISDWQCSNDEKFIVNNYNECRIYNNISSYLVVRIMFQAGGVKHIVNIKPDSKDGYAVKGEEEIKIPLSYDGVVKLGYILFN